MFPLHNDNVYNIYYNITYRIWIEEHIVKAGQSNVIGELYFLLFLGILNFGVLTNTVVMEKNTVQDKREYSQQPEEHKKAIKKLEKLPKGWTFAFNLFYGITKVWKTAKDGHFRAVGTWGLNGKIQTAGMFAISQSDSSI